MKKNLLGKFFSVALVAIVLLNLAPAVLASGFPYVATADYSNLTQSSVTLSGSVNPNGSSTTAWFEYGPTTSLGQKGSDFSAGNVNYQTSFSSSISNLNSNSVYYYRIVAENNYGISRGSIFSFSTSYSNSYSQVVGSSPLTTTNSAALISSNSAIFHGSVNPNNANTTAWFEYGPTASLGNTSQAQTIGSGNSYVATNTIALNLNANATYYYRIVAQNAYGNSYGSILSINTGNNNTAVTANNQDLSVLSKSLSQLNSALSGLGKSVSDNSSANTQTTAENAQVSSTGSSLVKLTLTSDKPTLKSGDEVVITAEIETFADISKVSLQINLDPSLVFDSSVASVFNKNGNTITYTIGDIAAKDVRVVKLNAHLSKDTNVSKITKATTTGVLGYSDYAGVAIAPLYTSLVIVVGGNSLFNTIFGNFGWGSGLAIFLVALLVVLIVVAVRRLMS